MTRHKTRLAQPEYKREYNRILFKRIACQYDRITRLLSFGRDRHWKAYLVSGLPQSSRPLALDFACGTGDLVKLLGARYPKGRILGLDLTKAMIGLARMRAGGNGIRWSVADMLHSPLKDGCADLITGGYALRNAPRLDDFLREIRRILRPGGTAAFLDFSRSSSRLKSFAQYCILWFWGGFWGLLACGKPSVYQYIAESLRLFPDHRDLERLLSTFGFEAVRTKRLFFGMTAIVTFRKPNSGF